MILRSMLSLAWAVIILFLIIYIFAIYFVQVSIQFLASGKNDAASTTLQTSFGRIHDGMLTLFLCITGGVEWGFLYEPLKKVGLHHVVVLSFFVCLMYFAVLNIITGVFVEGAIQRAQSEKESIIQDEVEQEKQVRSKLASLFEEIDIDRSGFIDLAEFEQMLSRPHVQACFTSIGLRFSQAWELFQLLDRKGTHKVESEDFVGGCMQLCGHGSSVDIATVLRELKRLAKIWSHQFSSLDQKVEALSATSMNQLDHTRSSARSL